MYLQFCLVAGLALLFGVGYLQQDSAPAAVTDPVDFVNPHYYSLEPQISRSEAVEEYKELLVEADEVMRRVLELGDKVYSVVTWESYNTSCNALAALLVVTLAPAVLPSDVVLLAVIVVVFCANERCVNAFKQLMLPGHAPQETPTSDFEDTESDDGSITTPSNPLPAGTVSDSAATPLIPCTSCSKLVAQTVNCAFCGDVYCAECCGNAVTKSRLGVTNPDTKHHMVSVCRDCVLMLPSEK